MSFICLLACFIFTISPPLNLRETPLLPPTTPLPCTTTSSTTVPLPSSFQASSAPSPLPHIAYLSVFIYCTRHCCCYITFPIRMHSLSLSPLSILSFILCSLLYMNIIQQFALRFAR